MQNFVEDNEDGISLVPQSKNPITQNIKQSKKRGLFGRILDAVLSQD